MRIDLNCPYAEKDVARRLGARWDAARKVWFIVDVEDLTPFMRWIKTKKAVVAPTVLSVQEDRISLVDFLNQYYRGAISLTFKSAKAFGIPYPLESGWAKKYASRTALLSVLSLGKTKGNAVPQAKTVIPKITGPKIVTQGCGCDVPPWEDCEHTDALAQQEMEKILSIGDFKSIAMQHSEV
jgi:hypothetical protein